MKSPFFKKKRAEGSITLGLSLQRLQQKQCNENLRFPLKPLLGAGEIVKIYTVHEVHNFM